MKEKIVVVTGATSGLGETLAKMYAKGGAIVVAQGRNEKKLSALKKWSDDYGYGLMDPLCLDLLEKNAAERFYQYVINKWNTIDIWINNAGFGYVGAYSGEIERDKAEKHRSGGADKRRFPCRHIGFTYKIRRIKRGKS